jgi:hypothetical protein
MRRFDGQVRTLAELNRKVTDLASTVLTRLTQKPHGVLGYAVTTTNQSGISTEADIAGLAATVTVPAGRLVKLSYSLALNNDGSPAADQVGRIRIKEDTTVLKLVDVNMETAGGTVGTASWCVEAPSAGAHTYKLSAEKPVGAGTIQVSSAGVKSEFLVEDIGSA